MRAPTSFANRTAYLRPAREQSEKSTGTRMVRISRCCARARQTLRFSFRHFADSHASRPNYVNFRLRRAFDCRYSEFFEIWDLLDQAGKGAAFFLRDPGLGWQVNPRTCIS